MNYVLYHYKIDGFDDCGYGCSYRNIQTILSAYSNKKNIVIPKIEDILKYFNQNYKKMYHKQLWIEPVQVSYYLTEMYDIKTENVLYIVNDYDTDKMLKTDIKDYMSNDRIYNVKSFNNLLNKILKHFENSNLPIIIDDGTYSYCLLNIENNNIIISDPHTTDSNNVLKKKNLSVLYNNFWMICIPEYIENTQV